LVVPVALVAGVAWGERRARRQASEQARRLDQFSAAMSDWLWEMDRDFRFTYISDRAEKVTGEPPGVAIGKTRRELAIAAEAKVGGDIEAITEAEAAREPYRDVVLRYVRRDGQVRWFRTSGLPIFDRTGGFQGYRGAASDITALIRTQETLAERQKLLESTQRVASLGWRVIDFVADTRIWSDNARALFGLASDAPLTMRSWMAAVHPDDRPSLKLIEDYPGHHGTRSYRVVLPGGKVRHLREEFEIERDVDGQPTRAVCTLLDVTELESARLVAEAANRAKGEFLSTVSHELRTPLTSIKGALGLIGGGVAGPLPERLKTLVDTANRNAERLALLVNDVLDLQRIEAGRLEFHFSPHNLATLIPQAVDAVRPYAAQFDVTYRFVSALDRARVRIDADRLMQVMNNLLSNAAKFSKSGQTIEIGLARHGNGFRISVADQGSGIPEEFRGRIFERFAQADSSDTRRSGGTGLGLAITKALVEGQGGKIGFESTVGVGATFFVDLPELPG